MYIIKVGDYYVADVVAEFGGFIGSIVLSKELQKIFTKAGAERIAKMVNGEAILFEDVTTNE